MKIKGIYTNAKLSTGKWLYSFWISDHIIPVDRDFEFIGEHSINKTNDDVEEVQFGSCIMTKVPQGLTNTFPNLKMLNIFHSKLKKISKNDLAEYTNLEEIYFEGNEIEFLPGDLFEDFEKLKVIQFPRNKLSLIDPIILNGIVLLCTVDFRGNPNYDKCFSIYNRHDKNATLEEIRLDLHEKFYSNINQQLELEDNNNQEQFEVTSSLTEDIRSFLVDETFKDFSIQIEDHNFPVHKFLLSARSPTLAKLLKSNPEVENLNLVDISVETFEKILNFLYTDELPGDDGINFMHLFAAAGKLKIKSLIDYAAKKLIDNIEVENALELLNLSNKYNHKELRQEAYEKIKKIYPPVKFKDEWAADPIKLEKAIEIIKQREEADKKMKEELEKLEM